jgi:hypothetical protein
MRDQTIIHFVGYRSGVLTREYSFDVREVASKPHVFRNPKWFPARNQGRRILALKRTFVVRPYEGLQSKK